MNHHSARRVIPVFFASDDRYAPCLAVAIRSMIEHASPRYTYRVYVLIDRMSEENRAALSSLGNEHMTVEFVNVSRKLDTLGSMMHLRDYYTKATYYRFFIPELFPQYAKGIYLDCDIVVLGDVSELWRTELGPNLLAAAPEEVMQRVDVFGRYVETVLGVPRDDYFSAGVLLMNLCEMRRVHIERQFVELLSRVKYRVTQDQDYLNVLCRHRVRLLDTAWNRTASPDADEGPLPEIAHFKINWKPWHYEGVAFEDYFWAYAEETPYEDALLAMLNGYTPADRARDEAQYASLVALAESETDACRASDRTYAGVLPFGAEPERVPEFSFSLGEPVASDRRA